MGDSTIKVNSLLKLPGIFFIQVMHSIYTTTLKFSLSPISIAVFQFDKHLLNIHSCQPFQGKVRIFNCSICLDYVLVYKEISWSRLYYISVGTSNNLGNWFYSELPQTCCMCVIISRVTIIFLNNSIGISF